MTEAHPFEQKLTDASGEILGEPVIKEAQQQSEKKHKHKFYDFPEALAVRCLCGVVRFGTRYGAAEYNPKTETTIKLSNGRILYATE